MADRIEADLVLQENVNAVVTQMGHSIPEKIRRMKEEGRVSMHDYLRAVGFGCIKEKTDLDMLLHIVTAAPDLEHMEHLPGQEMVYAEKSRDFAQNAGVTVRGEISPLRGFSCEYFFPHYTGRCISANEDVTAQKRSDREEYDGVCEISTQGMSIVFHMNRLMDYAGQNGIQKIQKEEIISEESFREDPDIYLEEGILSRFIKNAAVRLSALSISGKILLPVRRSKGQIKQKIKSGFRRAMMADAARSGDPGALENLAIEQLDSYSHALKRIGKEDILSVVDSYFMPCGIAYDQYSILGDIIDCSEEINQLTGEVLEQMIVVCNEMILDICMNKEDLLGEPLAGRRFLGNIWLQGVLDYE